MKRCKTEKINLKSWQTIATWPFKHNVCDSTKEHEPKWRAINGNSIMSKIVQLEYGRQSKQYNQWRQTMEIADNTPQNIYLDLSIFTHPSIYLVYYKQNKQRSYYILWFFEGSGMFFFGVSLIHISTWIIPGTIQEQAIKTLILICDCTT